MAQRRVHHLADRETPHIACHRQLQQCLGIRAGDFKLAQRRQIDTGRPFTARPIFVDGTVRRILRRRPKAFVVDERSRQRAGAGIETAVARQFRGGIGSHTVGVPFRKLGTAIVHAHLDIGGIPGIGRIDVVGTTGGSTDQIRQRPQQHIVAGAGPRFVAADAAIGLHERVVEKIERGPSGARRNPERRDRAVEVVGAVGVPRVAHVCVIFGRTGEHERVMPADSVAYHFHQRLHARVEVFAVQTGPRHRLTHQRARCRGIDAPLLPCCQRCRVEGDEIGTLFPLDIHDLDVVAGGHAIGAGRRCGHPHIELRGSERRRRLDGRWRLDGCGGQRQFEQGRRRLILRRHFLARSEQQAAHRRTRFDHGATARRTGIGK